MSNNPDTIITGLEYKTLEGYQNKFYGGGGKKKIIPPKFFYRAPHESWHNLITTKLEIESKNTYEFKKHFSYIRRVYLIIKLPEIKVAQKYKNLVRIAYTSNLAHHIHAKAGFYAGDGLCQTITPYSLDDYRNKVKNIKDYDYSIGNRPELQNFSTVLPVATLDLHPPWSFNRHPKLAFPLYEECLGKVYLTYNFKLDLSKLIRVKAIKEANGDFESVKFNWKYFEEINHQIPEPEVWCKYANISEEERKFRIKKETKKNVIDYIDIIEFKHNEDKRLGESLSISLSSDQPVEGISWKAQNRDAKIKNDRSNYTTNTSNLKEGHNPVINAEIKYGDMVRETKKDHYHYDRINPKIYFGHIPYDPGYNFYYYNDNPTFINQHGHTVVLDKVNKSEVKLNCTLGDFSILKQNDLIKKKEIDSEEVPKFVVEEENEYPDSAKDKLIVTLYVKKRLVFSKKTNKLFVISNKDSYDNYIINKKQN